MNSAALTIAAIERSLIDAGLMAPPLPPVCPLCNSLAFAGKHYVKCPTHGDVPESCYWRVSALSYTDRVSALIELRAAQAKAEIRRMARQAIEDIWNPPKPMRWLYSSSFALYRVPALGINTSSCLV